MVSDLARIVRDTGSVPLAWAGATHLQDYLNVGDALSAVMVSLVSGKPVRRVPFRSANPRLVAVGTIGQNISGGRAWFWGTGCSNYAFLAGGARLRYTPDPAMQAVVTATRGPISASLLGGGRLATRVFGDPVWLLPRFYRPTIEKRYDIGVIIHLSNLADRELECHPKPELRRYQVTGGDVGRVRLINTVTPVSVEGMKDKIDEILSCRRIVSTSLHGLVFAESYGIPCLYFPGWDGEAGLVNEKLSFDGRVDLRMLDLYAGVGRTSLPCYGQPRAKPTDWGKLCDAVDEAWEPVEIDEDALMNALPVDLDPLVPPEGGTIWDHPVLHANAYRHNVGEIRAEDRAASTASEQDDRRTARQSQKFLRQVGVPASAPAMLAPAPRSRRLRLRASDGGAQVPLTWVRGEPGIVNVGDALSAVIVSGLANLPVRHANSDERDERMAAVGTIGHGMRNGHVHFWGTGLDRTINPVEQGTPYAPPPETEITVHAMRGPFSAGALRQHGVEAPEVYGDPVYFLPRFMPMDHVEKTHELGIVLHLSELEPRGIDGQPKAEYLRYRVPDDMKGAVRIINMYSAATIDAMEAKVAEICSCKAILSTSLHGIVIGDAYGIPSAWFSYFGDGFTTLDPLQTSQKIDHRVRDLYAGMGYASLPAYCRQRHAATDWDNAIRSMQERVEPTGFGAEALFEAFPGPVAVDLDAERWPLSRALFDGLRF